MITLFYISGFFAIITTICSIFNTNPIHALLYLIASLLSISLVFFSLKASFAGIIEIIVYAGAIMVLFLFSIMMLDINNPDKSYDCTEFSFLSIKKNFGVLLMMSNFLMILLYVISKNNSSMINIFDLDISTKKIGIVLFSSYILVVEIASFLLLSALISVTQIVQENDTASNFNFTKLFLSKHNK